MQCPSRLDGPQSCVDDVIISCAEDTKEGFTGHLCKDLKDRGFSVTVVVDHWKLKREAIKESRVIIIVLSDEFVTCKFRLDKFSEIVNEFDRQLILPVFYHLRPSDVRDQKGIYKLPMAVHKNYVETTKLAYWTKALTDVADFSGWVLSSKNIYEYKCIEEISQKVSEYVASPVGLQLRVQKVNSLLFSGSDDGVRKVAICGEAGVGKTMVARAVYHSNAGNKFDYYYFLDKVDEVLSEHGLKSLVRKLLSEMVGNTDTNFENLDEGMSTIKQMLDKKRLFLIFEDLYDLEQLQYIVKLAKWLPSGSKVIITTKMKCLPDGIEIYEVDRFSNTEAYRLLGLRAFNSESINSKYISILERAKTWAGGLPYLLEWIGSNLAGKSVQECESLLDQYENTEKKQRLVRTSFDGSGEVQQISIALTQRKELAKVEKKFHFDFSVCPKEDIKVLLDKSLVKINDSDLVKLHDLTQAMVRDNFQPQYHFQTIQLQLFLGNTEYGKLEIQPPSSDRSMICNLTEEEEC